MSESLEDKAKRLGWSADFLAGVRKVKDNHPDETIEQYRARNRRARIAANLREAGEAAGRGRRRI